MAPGARWKFGAPMFEFDVFRKQMYCIEGSTCGIVGTFRRPNSDSAPWELCTLVPHRCAPASESLQKKRTKLYEVATHVLADLKR